MSAPRVKAISGTATFGAPSNEPRKKSFADVADVNVAQSFIDILLKQGHNRLYTARRYGNGQSEEIVSKLDLKGILLDPGDSLNHETVLRLAEESIKALNDRSTPFEELGANDELYNRVSFMDNVTLQ
ncbi:hypothetical protein OF83DRAFT_1168411 [Amylostereum chailletii]|nr:hypothetical protein OF83DRAFT_1168411 [Amylostereum chailletii]